MKSSVAQQHKSVCWAAKTLRKTFSMFLQCTQYQSIGRSAKYLFGNVVNCSHEAWHESAIGLICSPSRHFIAHFTTWSLKTPCGAGAGDLGWSKRRCHNKEDPSRMDGSVIVQGEWSPLCLNCGIFHCFQCTCRVPSCGNSGHTCFFASTMQQGNSSLGSNVMRHCSGWLATYAARIGITQWTKPQCMAYWPPSSLPPWKVPAETFIQSWKICCPGSFTSTLRSTQVL